MPTFLNARPARTRGLIFLRFGTLTKMLMPYRSIMGFFYVTVMFLCSSLSQPPFLSFFLKISVRGVKPQRDVSDCTWGWSVNIYCSRYDVIFPPIWFFIKINKKYNKICFSECPRPPEHKSGFIFCMKQTTSGKAAILFF